jgi:cyclase
MHESRVVSKNEHFRLERLADGIYAAIGTDDGGAMSNAGIVDLGDETLVFDAFLTRAAAGPLRSAAFELTGRLPRFLVHSHAHGDHVWGSAAFSPGTAIVSSAATAAMVSAEDRSAIDPADLKAFLGQLEDAMTQEEDDYARLSCASNLHPRRWLLEELPIVVAPATWIFEGRFELRGSKRRVVLHACDRAHTEGDVYLHCPEEGILFLGDLGFFYDLPAFVSPQGDAVAWARLLVDLESPGAEAYIPGHGPVGAVEDLRGQRRFLEIAVREARLALRSGETVEGLLERMRRTDYAKWERTTFYDASLQSVIDAVSRDGGAA